MSAALEKPVDVQTIKRILEANDGARIRTWLSICSRCGLCAESCFFYLANDRNPRMSPGYKVKITLGEMVRRKGKWDGAFLRECHDVAWGQCTLCKRCSQACPFGIDVATMISLVRTVCCSQGVVPEGLTRTAVNYQETGNQMGMSPEDFLDTCAWMAEESSEEVAGVEIPIDKAGAKYMYTVNAREPMFYPQELGLAAKIFTVAREDWTLPSLCWDSTNLPMFSGDRVLAGRIVRNMYNKALELGVQKILITECGHAYRSAAFEGPYLAGYPDGKPPVEVVHSVKLFYEYIRDGRIRIDPDRMLQEPVTYQDACNISRNGGLWEEGRRLVSYLCKDFRDMQPNRDHNHCCGGGGGFIPMGAEFRKRRMASGRIKAEQIRATGARTIIVPCHNCYDQIGDLNKEYDLGLKIVSFKELICEAMILPEEFQPVEGDSPRD